MDSLTIETYDKEAEKISKQHDALVPERLYQLVLKFFVPRGRSLDIGCGSGRDTAWLAENGFSVMGIDASRGMLEQARQRHPELIFRKIELPELSGIEDGYYSNVLCSAVLMHIEQDFLKIASENILRILRKDGILLLSFRGTKEASNRENGKLYETITKKMAIDLFVSESERLLFYESMLETGRDHVWHTFVFKK